MSVAVVIPNYNYGRFLEGCLNSVMSQTLLPQEVHVVDGGSTDNSETAFNGVFAEQWKVGYQFWQRMPRRGIADARNFGICKTRCEYIVPLDSDDWIEPTFIERCLELMRPGVGVVGTGLVWDDGRVQWPKEPITPLTLLEENRLFTCSMFRRRAWEEAGQYDTGPTYEDWGLWLAIALEGWEFRVVREPLYHYRTHGQSSTDRVTPARDAAYRDYLRRKYAVPSL